MPYYAEIKNGVVANKLHSDTPINLPHMREIAGFEAVAFGDIDHGDGTFSTPTPAPQPRTITNLAFLSRFTDVENAVIEFAALDDPAADQQTRMKQAGLRAQLKKQAQADFIDLDDPRTRAGVIGLEAATLLATGRALQILDAPVQPNERP